jgi:hypothetical protein
VCLRVANNLRTSPENCTSVNVLDTACETCAPGKNFILDPSFSVMALPTVETFGTGWQPIRSGARGGFEVSATFHWQQLHCI